MESCTKKRLDGSTCNSYAVNEHRGSGRCDRCWQEDRAEAAESRVAELRALLRRARPHVDAPLGTLAADIDLALNKVTS